MKHAVVNISKGLMNGIYRVLCACTKRRSEVVFLSRQADQPSYDFMQFARQFQDAGWITTMHVRKIRASGGTGSQEGGAGMVVYAGHVLRELLLLARCRVAVLDRYDPVVSLLDFECEPAGRRAAGQDVQRVPAQGNVGQGEAGVQVVAGQGAAGQHAAGQGIQPLHGEFPSKPVIVQAWHAFGAFKKFGYQTAGTREGHGADTLETFSIHRNYTWILCSSEAVRHAFAEAFAYPVERLVPFARPEYSYLLERAANANVQVHQANVQVHQASEQDETDAPMHANASAATLASGALGTDAASPAAPRVLVAPTLRMNSASPHPLRELHDRSNAFAQDTGAQVDWSFHPLEEGLEAPGGTNAALLEASCVVTDYSSIAYDAFLLGKPVVFYVPDHESYAQAPGLNADPVALCPHLCVATYEDLVATVRHALENPKWALDALASFAKPAFENADQQPRNLPELLAGKKCLG